HHLVNAPRHGPTRPPRILVQADLLYWYGLETDGCDGFRVLKTQVGNAAILVPAQLREILVVLVDDIVLDGLQMQRLFVKGVPWSEVVHIAGKDITFGHAGSIVEPIHEFGVGIRR